MTTFSWQSIGFAIHFQKCTEAPSLVWLQSYGCFSVRTNQPFENKDDHDLVTTGSICVFFKWHSKSHLKGQCWRAVSPVASWEIIYPETIWLLWSRDYQMTEGLSFHAFANFFRKSNLRLDKKFEKYLINKNLLKQKLHEVK